MRHPAVLVISEVWYPGWRASVDGREVDVLRANYATLGIAVPAGARHVEVMFDPASIRIGVVGTSVGVVLMAAALVLWAGQRLRRIA